MAAQGNAQEIGPASIPQAQPGVIPTGPMAPNAETPAGVYSNLGVNPSTDGYASNVPRSLITTESGGNWAAQNDAMGANGKRGRQVFRYVFWVPRIRRVGWLIFSFVLFWSLVVYEVNGDMPAEAHLCASRFNF